MSARHDQRRGVSRGRLRAPRLLAVFLISLGLIVGAGAAAATLLAPTTKPLCQPYHPCGSPPQAVHPLIDQTLWRSSSFGFSAEYPGAQTSVAGHNGGGVMLTTKLPDGSTGTILIQGIPTAQATPAQAITAQLHGLQGVSQIAADSDPSDQLLGASVGYRSGAGAVYSGDLAAPQGVGQPISLAAEAASDGHLTIAVTVAAPPRDSGPSSYLYQLADQIINSVVWPGGA
ncbi:MAG: hypothetical protein ACLP8S_05355 [Solirubrobacteraceae bacterium]